MKSKISLRTAVELGGTVVPRCSSGALGMIAAISFSGYAFAANTANDGLWFEIPPPDFSQPSNFLTQPRLTGDWGGYRAKLQDMGIDPFAIYFGQSAWNPVGGKTQGADNAAQFAFGSNVDLEKLIGLNGGAFNFMLNWQGGASNSISHIGNTVQDVYDYAYGLENVRLADIKYQQSLFDDKIVTTVGFFASGDNFARTPALCVFQNVGFCLHPFSLFLNSGFDAFPQGEWGGVLKFRPRDDFYVQGGIFDVDPTNGLRNSGFKINLDGSTGIMSLLEIGKSVALGSQGLSGEYKIGGYYDTSQVNDVAQPTINRSGRYGGYVVANQTILTLEPGSKRALNAFAQFAMGDSRTAIVPYTYSFELILQGPFESRPGDYVSVGFVRSQVNSRVLRKEEERAIDPVEEEIAKEQGENDLEIDYGFQLTPWLRVTPNVQWIGNPGALARDHIPDALVFGTQVLALL